MARAHRSTLALFLVAFAACGSIRESAPPAPAPAPAGPPVVPAVADNPDCVMVAPGPSVCGDSTCPVSVEGWLSCHRVAREARLVGGAAGASLVVSFYALTRAIDPARNPGITEVMEPAGIQQLDIDASQHVTVKTRVTYTGTTPPEEFVAARAGDGVALVRIARSGLVYQGTDDALAPLTSTTTGFALVESSGAPELLLPGVVDSRASPLVGTITRATRGPSGAWWTSPFTTLSTPPGILGGAFDADRKLHAFVSFGDTFNLFDIAEGGAPAVILAPIQQWVRAATILPGARLPTLTVHRPQDGAEPGAIEIVTPDPAGAYHTLAMELPLEKECTCGAGACLTREVRIEAADLVPAEGRAWLVYSYTLVDRDESTDPADPSCRVTIVTDRTHRVFGVAEVVADLSALRSRWEVSAPVRVFSVAARDHHLLVAHGHPDGVGYLEIDTSRLPP